MIISVHEANDVHVRISPSALHFPSSLPLPFLLHLLGSIPSLPLFFSSSLPFSLLSALPLPSLLLSLPSPCFPLSYSCAVSLISSDGAQGPSQPSNHHWTEEDRGGHTACTRLATCMYMYIIALPRLCHWTLLESLPGIHMWDYTGIMTCVQSVCMHTLCITCNTWLTQIYIIHVYKCTCKCIYYAEFYLAIFWRGEDEFQVQVNMVAWNSEYLQYVHS